MQLVPALDGDVFAITEDGSVFRYGPDGTVRSGWPVRPGGPIVAAWDPIVPDDASGGPGQDATAIKIGLIAVSRQGDDALVTRIGPDGIVTGSWTIINAWPKSLQEGRVPVIGDVGPEGELYLHFAGSTAITRIGPGTGELESLMMENGELMQLAVNHDGTIYGITSNMDIWSWHKSTDGQPRSGVLYRRFFAAAPFGRGW